LVIDHAGAVYMHGFVEDEIAWTLDTDKRAVNKSQAARKHQHKAKSLTHCPECRAVRFEGDPCPVCGWQPRPPRVPPKITIIDGQLGRLDHNREFQAIRQDRQRFFSGLLFYAEQRGYQPGWASHKFREKFGDWPNGLSREAAPPGPEQLSWIRSRNIAYAKARGARKWS